MTSVIGSQSTTTSSNGANDALTEFAPAKVNLSLTVHGRRTDGYHELSSVVAFAGVGDTLILHPGDAYELRDDGPFAAAVDGENLVTRAVDRARKSEPRLRAGAFHLTKALPVAAGLGGGSSDAAAALRLLARANPDLVANVDWPALARSLGADVPVCLEPRAALMSGIGERVQRIASWPGISAVLVNPRVPLSTATVFGALGAPPLAGQQEALRASPPAPPSFEGVEALLEFLDMQRNDLEATARRLCPQVGEVLTALAALPEVLATRMSGSGPTCFALFHTASEARAAAAALSDSYPQWWIAATELA